MYLRNQSARLLRFCLIQFALFSCLAWDPRSFASGPPRKPQPRDDQHMSAMGRLARMVALARSQRKGGAGQSFQARSDKFQPPADDDADGPAGGQAELSIAIDVTGQHIIVGFNDTRGFNLNPMAVSGFAFSDDGGLTFTDGGQLPVTNNPALNGSVGSALYPAVFGDPDVKYVPGGGGLQFIYSSLMLKGVGTAPNFSGTIQTLCIHRSTDGGHTWQGPFEVTAATVANGTADKEFIDVDPDTGRVLVSWSNFGSGADISTAFCDNIMTGNPPVWSSRSVLNGGALSDQGSIPRFAGNNSSNVYVAWARSFTGNANNIGFARSTNNGASWFPASNLRSPDFFTIDYILGNDRVHQFPSLAVDNSPGTNQGTIYVVYADNNSHDGADIAFQRSTNAGVTFSSPIYLNSRPGSDRAQWFPCVTADPQSGRVSVIYYDQGIATSGDLTEMTWVFSDDGGLTWSGPRPISSRPFHAGYGNDTGQPNLGDYIGATAQNGVVYAAWAGTPSLMSFVDGQPESKFSVPDFYVVGASNPGPALSLGDVSFTESGENGFLDPGDTAQFQLPLRNYVTNSTVGTTSYTSVTATLTTATPGVMIPNATQSYSDVFPGAAQTNLAPFGVSLQPGFVVGTRIEFALTVNAAQGTTLLLFSQPTGTPVAAAIFAEDFDGVAAGSLPAGWTAIHQGGNNSVPWSTTNNVPSAPGDNALFHIDAEDGVGNDATRWERIATPNITIPSNSAYVTLEFDIWYDTEDNPGFNIYAFDGATLRISDFTEGHFNRANLAEAFAEEITTGNLSHFPKHLPRSDDSNYFQDMSVWGGDSGGWKHVHMKLPGMAGTTIQLRWDYTQDVNGTAADARPTHTYSGVAIDNIVLNNVTLGAPPVITAQPSSQLLNRGQDALLSVSASGYGPLSFQWKFSKAEIISETNSVLSLTNIQSSAAGTYSVVVTNTYGLAISSNAVLSVLDFVGVPAAGPHPLVVDFINLSGGSISNYLWDFGDGNLGTGINVENTYTNPGIYTVSLTGYGADGTSTLVFADYIVVTNPPPVIADFTFGPTNGFAPLTVFFTNTSAGASSFSWDFGDGNFSAEINPANTYTNAGSYMVNLQAAGPGGMSTLTNYVVVTDPPPPVVPAFTADPTNGVAPLTVYFTNLSSGAMDYAWDFGDGGVSTEINPFNTYTNAGIYSVSLVAVGAGGTNLLTITNYVVITNPPPPVVAAFTADPTNGVAPLTVYFTNLSSGAMDYAWDFGDGGVSTEINPANTYTNAGTYTVSLVAVGAGGTNALTLTNYVVITNPPPPAVADFIAEPTNGAVPLTVYFTNVSADANDFSWHFGDGNVSTAIQPAYTYTNAGTYSVSLIAIGAGGTNMLTRTNYIVITNPPPPVVADFTASPTNGVAPLTVYFTNLSSGANGYFWNLGGGNSSPDPEPVTIYTNPGSYTVTLTAIGPGGTNDSVKTNYVVVSAPARLVIEQGLIDFVFVFTGRVAEAGLVISNAGDVNLSGTAMLSAGPFALVDFASISVTNLSWELAALSSTNITLRFAPASPGNFSNEVVFASNGGSATDNLQGQGVIAPRLHVTEVDSAHVILSFDSIPGKDYRIEYKDSLNDPQWQLLQTMPGDGSTLATTNSIAAALHRFYRLSIE